MTHANEEKSRIYDFIAIGAGPSNLSLAVQAFEGQSASGHNWLVLEKADQVRWHPGMLLRNSRLDTHFAKDLVMMINPTSKFTFANYLSVHGKLESFLNCGKTSPFRADFDQYIQWVARELGEHILPSHEVSEIRASDDGVFSVCIQTNEKHEYSIKAKNVVIGVGASAANPLGVDIGNPRIIHSSVFLEKVNKIGRFKESDKILIVGAGQSAAELINYCVTETQSEVSCVLNDFGLTTKEGTAFINECYNGDFIDNFFRMPSEMRSWFVERRKNMNYGVVDADLIDELYNNCYHAKNFEGRKIEFLQFSRLLDATPNPHAVSTTIHNRKTDTIQRQSFDYVIMACGYDMSHSFQLLDGHLSEPNTDCDGLPIVNRDYSLDYCSNRSNHGKIYLNGNVSRSHGPAGDVLSVIAHRSRDILNSIRQA